MPAHNLITQSFIEISPQSKAIASREVCVNGQTTDRTDGQRMAGQPAGRPVNIMHAPPIVDERMKIERRAICLRQLK